MIAMTYILYQLYAANWDRYDRVDSNVLEIIW